MRAPFFPSACLLLPVSLPLWCRWSLLLSGVYFRSLASFSLSLFLSAAPCSLRGLSVLSSLLPLPFAVFPRTCLTPAGVCFPFGFGARRARLAFCPRFPPREGRPGRPFVSAFPSDARFRPLPGFACFGTFFVHSAFRFPVRWARCSVLCRFFRLPTVARLLALSLCVAFSFPWLLLVLARFLSRRRRGEASSSVCSCALALSRAAPWPLLRSWLLCSLVFGLLPHCSLCALSSLAVGPCPVAGLCTPVHRRRPGVRSCLGLLLAVSSPALPFEVVVVLRIGVVVFGRVFGSVVLLCSRWPRLLLIVACSRSAWSVRCLPRVF